MSDLVFLIYQYTLIFVIGASLGSFLNVMVYRIPLKKSVVKPASSCPNCNHKIRWFENIPIFSWLFLKGKCSSCDTKISKEYFLVELFFAMFSIAFFYITELNYHYTNIALYFMCYFLLTLSIIDFKIKMVPISLLILSFFSGVISNPDYMSGLYTGFAILGFFYMFKLTYEHFRGIEVLGEGDLPILALYGVLLGISNQLIFGILLACFIGMAFAIYFKVSKGEVELPFVPSLSLSLVIIHLYYIDVPKNFLQLII